MIREVVWQRGLRGRERKIQVGIRIEVLCRGRMIGQKKVGEVGGKQTLLVDVKTNCFENIILSPGEISTMVSSGQVSQREREKA